VVIMIGSTGGGPHQGPEPRGLRRTRPDPADRATHLAELAASLHDAGDKQDTGQAVIERALALVPDADWASLTVRARRDSYVTLAASSPEARHADELQYALGEGPCVDAADNADWYRSGSVRDDQRWPRWGPRAAELGVGSLLSVRLVGAHQPVGALNMYAAGDGLFDDNEQIDLALLAGIHAAVAIVSADERDGLHRALSSRHLIGVAQGILMERYELGMDQAFELLRRYSSNLNTKLVELATEVVTTGHLPHLPQTDGSGRQPR
jgi:hypothetical protein